MRLTLLYTPSIYIYIVSCSLLRIRLYMFRTARNVAVLYDREENYREILLEFRAETLARNIGVFHSREKEIPRNRAGVLRANSTVPPGSQQQCHRIIG